MRHYAKLLRATLTALFTLLAVEGVAVAGPGKAFCAEHRPKSAASSRPGPLTNRAVAHPRRKAVEPS